MLCGLPIIKEAAEGFFLEFDAKADFPVSLALIASVVIGENFAVGEVAVIMQPGVLLEEMAVAKAGSGIEKIVRLTPETACVIRNGRELMVPAGSVALNEHVRVLPGERIPEDGVITSGESSVDQSVMTGESLPVDKKPGDTVTSGTVNRFGTFDMTATKVVSDRNIERMIRLVQSAVAGKAKIVRLADKWATWIVVTALTAAFITRIVTWEPVRAVTILVVFCPCALVLAAPTAIMAAIGSTTGHGVLVRKGDAFVRLAQVKRIAFDKTVTLTEGQLEVAGCVSTKAELTDDALFELLAAVEHLSEHPIGKAVAASRAKAGHDLPEAAQAFQMQGGCGVKGVVNGTDFKAGRAEWLKAEGVTGVESLEEKARAWEEKGATVIYAAVNG